MSKHSQLVVLSETVRIQRMEQDDYLALTDIAKFRSPDTPADIIKNWLRSRSTIELPGLWEKLHKPDFKVVEFDHFRLEVGETTVISPCGKRWIT